MIGAGPRGTHCLALIYSKVIHSIIKHQKIGLTKSTGWRHDNKCCQVPATSFKTIMTIVSPTIVLTMPSYNLHLIFSPIVEPKQWKSYEPESETSVATDIDVDL